MSSTIHMRVEVRTPDAQDGTWKMIGMAFQNANYKPNALPIAFWNEPLTYEPWESQDYEIFTALANVRREDIKNKEVQTISNPRGVPKDASEEVKEWAKDIDGYAYSWLTLDEIMSHVPFLSPESENRWDALIDTLSQFYARFGTRFEDIRIVFYFKK